MTDLTTAYEQHAPELRRFACRLVGVEDADDLVQQVFLESLACLDRYEERGLMRAWLYARLRCRCIDLLRRRARRPSEPLGEYAVAFDEERLIGQIDGQLLLQQAPIAPRQRQALWLHYGCELTLDETGAVLGCGRNAVKALTHRGIAAVRDGAA